MPEPYMSVSEAAEYLSVHPSTIRRWIDQGRLPAHRLGLRLSDLAKLVVPRSPEPASADVSVESLTAEERERGLKAVEELARLREEDLTRRDGKPYSPSWQLLDKARRERIEALTDEQ